MHQSSYRAFPWVLWKWSFIPLSALRRTRHPTVHSMAGISPESTRDLLTPALFPVHHLWQQFPVSALQRTWNGIRHRQAPVSEKLLVPQWATQSIFWVAPCAAAALVGGESPGPRPQWCSSLTASVLKTKVFLPGIVRLRQGLMLPVLPVLFWWQSRNSGSSQSFGVKAWYSADSDWFWLLVFFYFLSQIGILLTNPNLVSWVTLYLLNFKVGLALEKKKKAFPH